MQAGTRSPADLQAGPENMRGGSSEDPENHPEKSAVQTHAASLHKSATLECRTRTV